MIVLLVEDEAPKRQHVGNFLQTEFRDVEISYANSVRSAIQALVHQKPDLLVLDMSLPTFDVGPTEAGGRPQGFGGVELLRNMELEEIECPVVVLTGYDAFAKAGGQVGLDTLNEELAAAHPRVFRGMLHYNSAYGDWQDRLRKLCGDLGFATK
jgi:CheY-like chemotaxis protein